MATAKKTASGMWKCRVYSHTDAEGKKHYKAFLGATKQEAEQDALKFSASIDRMRRTDLTVADAIAGYIRAKSGVLSPSTIRGYKILERNNYSAIGTIRIRKLSTDRVQTWVSDQASKLSAKTVKNAFGLLTASVRFYAPEIIWRITLPTIIKNRRMAVSDAEILMLYNAAQGYMKTAIGLAAFGSLRAGEICSLTYADILDDGIVYVHSDMVRSPEGGWVIKEIPKTTTSVRYVDTIPAAVLDQLGTGSPDAPCVGHTPNRISDNFRNLCKRQGITGIRFHDLRAYFASSGAGIMPDVYLSARGGWDATASNVMKEHYQKQKEVESKRYAARLRHRFEKMLKNV